MEPVVKIENLRLSFHGFLGKVEAVKGVSLQVFPGETLALVGESGCGKTALCRSIMMLHADHAEIEEGRIRLCGRDVCSLSEKELEAVRGRDAAMVFQDPMASLNPVFSIGRQIMEPILIHEKVSSQQAKDRALALLSAVGIGDAESRFHQYPHHFSGGMRQRVAIAIALACSPALLIADEPTTALDGENQAQVMTLLRGICKEENRAVLFVTHDLGLAETMADRIAVMKDGVIVESGRTEEVFENPQHEYTKRLLRYARYGKSGSHFHGKAGAGREGAERDGAAQGNPDFSTTFENLSIPVASGTCENPEIPAVPAMVTVSGLSKLFSIGKKQINKVLQDFSLTIEKGEIVGIVGPSGCGKSTLARCLAGIYKPDAGQIDFAEGCRRQMIFQDSASALNPRLTLAQSIAEPLVLQRKKERKPLSREEKARRVADVMEQVELSADLAERYPYDVSGGQRQRAAIARALITDPDFIIADEPISSLDVTIQAEIIHLLKAIHDERNLTMLLISHDLPMVEHVSDRIVEMGK